MSNFSYRLFAVASLLALLRPAAADDIDLFVKARPSNDIPNVLFVLDNGANFEATTDDSCVLNDGKNSPPSLGKTAGGLEQCALYNVIKELEPGSVRLGLMVYNANTVQTIDGVNCSSITEGSGKNRVTSFPGGCLVYETQLLTVQAKKDLLAWIAKWKTTGSGPGQIKANSQATGATMQESWAHFAGRMGVSGFDYANKKPPAACSNYIIYIGNAVNSQGTPGDATGNKGPKDALSGTNPTARMNASPVASAAQKNPLIEQISTQCGKTGSFTFPVSSHENKGFYADEWARYMYENTTLPITTYSIGFLGDSCQESYEATLVNMADEGGGKFYATRTYEELIAAIQSALNEMLTRNSVFASVSLPISVNTEGTYLNQVYIGMFRPDGNARPRWVGNLKQYRLGRYSATDASGKTGELMLVDARTPYKPAIADTKTGFLANCALSYWTPTSVDSPYWTELTEANCKDVANSTTSDHPDGPVVEKGGQGYTLRKMAADKRNLKTCGNVTCAKDLLDFDEDEIAISNTLLGAMSDDEADVLVNWARGLNNKGSAEGKAVNPDEKADEKFVAMDKMRPSVHGDVVHSRPVAINYAPWKDEPEVVVFYGSNDGVLRAINGNRTEELDSVGPGEELWGFVPPEFFDHYKRLRENTVPITLKGEDTASSEPKPYGFDGAISALVEDDRKWIFATMRRGGRMIYAFDVTNITTNQDSPELLWRWGCRDDSPDPGCSLLVEMGQTWSAPRLMKTRGYGANPDPADLTGSTRIPDPLLIFGAGYDTCEDSDPHVCGENPRGSAIYVVDAETGLPKKTFQTERSVVGDVFVVPDIDNPDPDLRGLALYAYAVDTGGNVYRISGSDASKPFGNSPPVEWQITKIASLGCASGVTSCAPNRKFMYMPDVVRDGSGYVILVGSGDREKPLRDYSAALSVENHFFMLRDYPKSGDWLSSEFETCGGNYLCLDSLLRIPADAAKPDLSGLPDKKGWYLDLGPGEQVVTSAITVYGGTTFSTHTPDEPEEGACTSDLGDARVYNVKFADASPAKGNKISAEVDGGGLPPSPVAGIVKLDTGEEVSFIIGASGKSPLEGGEPVPPIQSTLPKSITYWYIER